MGVDRFFRKSIIGSGSVNLNDYQTTGSILVNGATEILNAPSGTTPYFELFVMSAGNSVIQFHLQASGAFHWRVMAWNSKLWSSWIKIIEGFG